MARRRLTLRVSRRRRSTLAAASRTLRATRARAITPLSAFVHDVSELLALRWRKRIPHVQPVIDPGFLHGQLRGADFLQLAVNRGAVRLVGGEKIVQVDSLHLKIGSVAYRRFSEIRLLLANFCDLFGRDANLFADGRITQNTREAEFPPSPARSAHAHSVALTPATVRATPPWPLHWSHSPHVVAWPEPIRSCLPIGRRTRGVALGKDRRATERESQDCKSGFRTNIHDVILPSSEFRRCYVEFHPAGEKVPNMYGGPARESEKTAARQLPIPNCLRTTLLGEVTEASASWSRGRSGFRRSRAHAGDS